MDFKVKSLSYHLIQEWFGVEVPNLWDWFNNNRNKVHNKCIWIILRPIPLHTQFLEKLPLTELIPGAKKFGDHWFGAS